MLGSSLNRIVGIILVVLLTPLSLHSIVFVSDQGFSFLDGSGEQQSVRLAGVDDRDLVFWDRSTDQGSPPGWLVKIPRSPAPLVYDVVVNGSGDSADNLSLGFEIGSELNWERLSGQSKLLVNYPFEEGTFFDTTGFLGVRIFTDGDEAPPSYGWIRIEHSAADATFTVHDWAWNSTPGEPIQAGEIPEPKVYALILGVGVLVFVAGRRLRRREGDLRELRG